MKESMIEQAVEKLAEEFPNLNWDFEPDPDDPESGGISQWLGTEEEEVMVCLFQGKTIREPFHRQDFFFVNYAYQGDYCALSRTRENEITIREGDLYMGQPYSGYALHGQSPTSIRIAGILIRRDAFFREYLAAMAAEPEMFRFFLAPRIDRFSDAFLHFRPDPDSLIRPLLDLMIVEYAGRGADTQQILKPLVVSFLMLLAREYGKGKKARSGGEGEPVLSSIESMLSYIDAHLEHVTLTDLSREFGYHPNYVSGLLRRKTGRTFSRLLLEARMRRATLLMRETSLPLERIAEMSGYPNPSNFYKAFRAFYGAPPRAYQKRIREDENNPVDRNVC